MTDLVIQFFSIIFITGLFVFIAGIIIGGLIFVLQKSKRYRKYLTDMYVSARIRELAGDAKLDLDKEESSYISWRKKTKAEYNRFDLDNTIEEDLIEGINNMPKTKKK